MTDWKKELADWCEGVKEFNTQMPEAGHDFRKLHVDVSKDGAISTKNKELMGFVIGIVQRCDDCITTHCDAAIKTGATMDEIKEAIQIALLMGGGPEYMYGGHAIEVAKQLMKDKWSNN